MKGFGDEIPERVQSSSPDVFLLRCLQKYDILSEEILHMKEEAR